MQFSKHYTREEARELLPQVTKWLGRIALVREVMSRDEKRVSELMKSGNDIGGATVNSWLTSLADLRESLAEFQRRDIQIKDLDRGLVDFPAIIGGREVFLCWENGEEDIEFWHDLDTGFAGREKL
jgi:hypothetical protein